MNTKFKPEQHLKAFEEWRLSHKSTSFTRKEMQKAMPDLPTTPSFWVALFNSGLFKRISKSEYVLSNPEFIINVKSLEGIYLRYCNKMRKYYRSKNHKKKLIEKEQAIKLLTESGYIVIKPEKIYL